MATLPPVLSRCPVCGEELTVTRLHCQTCATAIEGRFRLGRFGRLSPEQLAFVEVFVKNRGIIKDVEAELGISYPTVRARLDEAIRALGYAVGDEPARSRPADGPGPGEPTEPTEPGPILNRKAERRRILEELQAKRIGAEEAARRLAALGERG